ncbi:hypothetical protein BGX34_007863 [Mortierella sp. NVP85]|nr:hypothetical protein BGX34_007863 [Mortierella sp. NVP85]
MKSIIALFALGLSCFQSLALAQSPTEAPPTFSNTPGLTVTKPFNGMVVNQGTSVGIMATIAQYPISSVIISVGKTDGSSNTTVVDLKGVSMPRLMQVWDVAAERFPVGDYHFQIIATPNLNAKQAARPVATNATSTAAAAVPTQPTTTTPSASVYYWRGLIRVEGSKTSSAGSVQGAMTIVYKMGFALGALAFGFTTLF